MDVGLKVYEIVFNGEVVAITPECSEQWVFVLYKNIKKDFKNQGKKGTLLLRVAGEPFPVKCRTLK